MEDTSECISRRWNDMDIDILVRIFQNLNIFELTSGVGQVCQTWRMAACDPLLWKTLDMSLLKSNFIKIPLEPYVYVDARSDKTFTRVLKIALNLSRGHIHTLIFHYNMYVSDDQLTYTAERCPKLRRLIMPAWNRIKKTGICRAIEAWSELESLTMPSISNSPYLIEQISRSCKNFSELKIMGPCDVLFASSLATFLPDLKVLSLRCSTLSRDALLIILDGMIGLEVLNLSHCMIVEVPPYPGARRVVMELDKGLIERASRLKGFLTCMSGSCEMCRRTRNDEGLMRWYKYEEDLWRVDEVASLAF
ncbi:F-box family protein [Striga asiatica]|uniref:F-box family protein n=1 Tax=Striga asiatica TaxID=4170 RepID=A0A5A7NXL0_STRAF|nr:F-box family protein [Striga asiatica]